MRRANYTRTGERITGNIIRIRRTRAQNRVGYESSDGRPYPTLPIDRNRPRTERLDGYTELVLSRTVRVFRSNERTCLVRPRGARPTTFRKRTAAERNSAGFSDFSATDGLSSRAFGVTRNGKNREKRAPVFVQRKRRATA